jgi:hypothetical protein
MKWSIKKNVSIQAIVALLLLISAGISAVHPTTVSMSTKINTVESTFHFGDVPFITVSVTPSSLVYGQRILSGQTFATMQLPGEGLSTVIGEAQLPTISRFIEIPQGANPELLMGNNFIAGVAASLKDCPCSTIACENRRSICHIHHE